MIHRAEKTGNYTVMSNYHFQENEMSLKAKGLLSLMLSLPETWEFSINGLAALSHDGRDGVNAALQELERFGYLVRSRKTDDRGRLCGYEYDVYEMPLTKKPYTDNPHTETPYTENPLTDKPHTENPQVIRTKGEKTKRSRTKGINESSNDTEYKEQLFTSVDSFSICAEQFENSSALTLPLNDGTEYSVLQSTVDEYAKLYPAVDVMQELRNMRGWLIAHPTNRKTKRGINAFINNWLCKEQDKRGGAKVGAGISTNTNIYAKIGRVL